MSNNRLRVGTIVDTFLYQTLDFQLEQLPLSLDDYGDIIRYRELDMLLVESCYEDVTGQWSTIEGAGSEGLAALQSLLAQARAHGVPAVYWITCDSLCDGGVAAVAQGFDFVFCADAALIKPLAAQNISSHYLPPGIEPQLYQRSFSDLSAATEAPFSLLYDGLSDLFRVASIKTLLTAIGQDFLLDIIDSRFHFPETELAQLGPLADNYIDSDAINGRRSLINHCGALLTAAGSLKSHTENVILSLEAMAQLKPVLHLGALDCEDIRAGMVTCYTDAAVLQANLFKFAGDPLFCQRKAIIQWREVLQKHTIGHRLQRLCEVAGLPFAWSEFRQATAITVCFEQQQVIRAIENYSRQSYAAKSLVLGLSGSARLTDKIKRRCAGRADIELLQLPQGCSLAFCLARAAQRAQGEYLFRLNVDDFYAAHYLLDQMLLLHYNVADIVVKPPASIRVQQKKHSGLHHFADLALSNLPLDQLPLPRVMLAGHVFGAKKAIFQHFMQFKDAWGQVDELLVDYLLQQGCSVVLGHPYNALAASEQQSCGTTPPGSPEAVAGIDDFAV